MSTLKKISLVVTLLVSVVGCAGTIKLPLKDQPGIAIPLKAEDRLVLYNAKKYCAEPSPDAFRSYAKSLGLGAKFGENAAGSLSSAELSNAASIGLRTQSITLMRDILYRMCEAFNNGALGEVMAATLLGRSQDLVAVVLAIEQLTGTVAANQVVLTGTAGADAGTGLDDYKQLLNSAKQIEKARKQEMEDAKEKRDDRKKALDNANKDDRDRAEKHLMMLKKSSRRLKSGSTTRKMFGDPWNPQRILSPQVRQQLHLEAVNSAGSSSREN